MKINFRAKLIVQILILSILCVFLFSARDALALFSISVSPRQGGQELEFSPAVPGSGEINAELDVNIRTDLATQYELRQEPLMPLRNGRGDEIAWDNFSVRGLRGTNQLGTLRTEPYKVVNYVLYTSNANGSADSFTLVYTLKTPLSASPDFYRGQIRFTLTPINSSQSSVSQVLNVIAEVKTQEGEGLKPFIEIIPSSGGRLIKLSSKKDDAKAFDVALKVNGSYGSQFRIKQVLSGPLQSTEGVQLGYEALDIETKEIDKGTGIARSPFSVAPQIIYTSTPGGEADGNFIITYSLGDSAEYKAGRYKTRIQYFLEQAGLDTKLETLELEVEIESVFDLIFKSQDEQTDTLEFHDLKPTELINTREVVIQVKTNLGKQYQVSQNVLSDLTSPKGERIPPEKWTLRTEGLNTRGTLKIPNKTGVKKGETVLFISNNQGSSDEFKIIYELVYPKEVLAGTYSTRITYSLSQI